MCISTGQLRAVGAGMDEACTAGFRLE